MPELCSDPDQIRRDATAAGTPVLELSTKDVTSKDQFFDAVRRALPQDPPLGTYRSVWDALADSVFGGLMLLDATHADVLWLDSGDFAEASPAEFSVACSVFDQVVQQVSDPKTTAGHPMEVTVWRVL